MATLISLDPQLSPVALWADVAACAQAWSRERGLALRDAVVLLPFAGLLAPARRAFATAGGWLPRIETAATLAAALGPAAPPEPGAVSFDAAFDALVAAALLQRQAWAAEWPQRDPRGFDVAVRRVVETAHDFARVAATLPPDERDGWWTQAREQLGPAAQPGATERLLARIALEWAAQAPPPATDALFALRPAAWIVVRAGGTAALPEALARHAGSPSIVFDADSALTAPSAGRLQSIVCDGFEHEAQSAAACVLDHLRRGERPVALIAQDRVLVRRVRALLARQQVSIADETGWRLATTRAAAPVMALLRAARPDASCDELLDCLKAGAALGDIDALEQALRRHGFARIAAVDASRLDDIAAACWRAAVQRLAPLRGAQRQPLAGWLAALRTALDGLGLEADAAGQQVLAALYAPGRVHDAPLTRAAFSAWVDATLEQSSFVPSDAPTEPAVVITPLARAMLRPFGAVVLPAADATRLGTAGEPQPLLGDALAGALGLPTMAALREAERIAFAQLQRAPALSLLRRQRDGDEPLAPSPLLERLAWRRRRAGLDPLPQGEPSLVVRRLAPTPLARPLPAPRGVPPRLSASAVEALRDCPYRFYARSVLRLSDADELDDEPAKRDYGIWLHAVLLRFHATRALADAASETARLLALGRELREAHGFDAAAFLPFAAQFERFAPLYIAWQHGRDAVGASFEGGEVDRQSRPVALAGVELRGRIDRIDRERDGTPMLFDYKTGSLERLRERLRDPLEDTQLAMYALLLGGESPPRAAYVALDDGERILKLEHRDVGASVEALLDGLAGELQRLRDGAALPALGEGRVCETCEARGLCRRDDWT